MGIDIFTFVHVCYDGNYCQSIRQQTGSERKPFVKMDAPHRTILHSYVAFALLCGISHRTGGVLNAGKNIRAFTKRKYDRMADLPSTRSDI